MKTFYYNGTIITMKETALYAEAVCVENGRIQAVGTLDDVMQYKTSLLTLAGGSETKNLLTWTKILQIKPTAKKT